MAVARGRLAEAIAVDAGRLAGLIESPSPGSEHVGRDGLNFPVADVNGSELNKRACE